MVKFRLFFGDMRAYRQTDRQIDRHADRLIIILRISTGIEVKHRRTVAQGLQYSAPNVLMNSNSVTPSGAKYIYMWTRKNLRLSTNNSLYHENSTIWILWVYKYCPSNADIAVDLESFQARHALSSLSIVLSQCPN